MSMSVCIEPYTTSFKLTIPAPVTTLLQIELQKNLRLPIRMDCSMLNVPPIGVETVIDIDIEKGRAWIVNDDIYSDELQKKLSISHLFQKEMSLSAMQESCSLKRVRVVNDDISRDISELQKKTSVSYMLQNLV